jgi:hypothetical protein
MSLESGNERFRSATLPETFGLPGVLNTEQRRTLYGKERIQDTRRAIPRHVERHLLRREKDPHCTPKNGKGGA